MRTHRFRTAPQTVAFAAGLCLAGAAAHPAFAQPADRALLDQMPGRGIEYRMPERVFPRELDERLRHKAQYMWFVHGEVHVERVGKWTSVPLERWRELIWDFAPVSCTGDPGRPHQWGRCPFTGKPFGGAHMSEDDFVKTPFRARAAGGNIVYAREEDMPADYPARPNHTEAIPHLDGTTRAYRFYVPPEFKNAGPEHDSARRNWFCPAGEVWRARVIILMRRVIPDLLAAVLLKDDRAAAVTLAAVLDRIAEVYPGLPLYCLAKAHGLARGPDHKRYLTAAEYRSAAGRQPYLHAMSRDQYPPWYVDIYDDTYAKLYKGGWADAMTGDMGMIAAAFDIVRDLPDVRAYSTKKYGAATAWESRFRKRCLDEMSFLAMATPGGQGNTAHEYIKGAVPLGIATRNAAVFRKGLDIVETYMVNNTFPDAMAGDAAFNYAAMTQGTMMGLAWLNRHYGGVDLAERFPLMKELGRLGWKPITTLYNITSKHADAHSQFYRPQYDKRWGHPAPEPGKLPYERYEASQFFPFYGMSVLRGGAPGRRTELIVSHQNAWQHSHYDRLGYQLLHEGVECLPDFGYCVYSIGPDKPPWRDIKLGYELLGLPPTAGNERWGPWRYGYSMQPEAHNVAMVDHWLQVDSAFCRVYGFSGAAGMADPGWWAQFLDVDGASLFAERPNKVDTYRRQLAMITLPGGSALVLDIFRIRGGARHDLFVHVPADTPAPLAGRGEPIGSSWSDYLALEQGRDKLTGATVRGYGAAGKLVTGLRRHAMPDDTWHSEWHIQPSRAIPTSAADRRHYEQWPDLLHDVRLAAWSHAGGGPAQSELISARGPWPGYMTVNDPKTGRAQMNIATVGLKDALDFRIFTRTAPEPGLESVFVQALEGRTPDLPPELTDFKVAASAPLAAGGGVLCELKTAAGPGVCVSTLNGAPFEAGGVRLEGRLGIALPAAGRLALYDGTRFEALGWGVTLEPGCEATLAGVVGDLTGRPTESALLVRSARPIPTDGTLSNRQVYVWHQFAGQQSVYTIQRVTAGPAGLWRIDLAGTPPFILQRAYVLNISAAKPRKMQRDSQFHLFIHSTNVAGRRIRFPRTGYDTAMVSCDRSNFSVETDPPPGKVAQGDPFVVYSVQPGDRVTIPSFFACTGLPAGEGERKLDLESSGDARLELPGAWHRAGLAMPDGRHVELRTARAGAGTAVELEHRLLADGRGTVVLGR